MQFTWAVVILACFAVVSGQPVTFCSKYAGALNITESALMQTAIGKIALDVATNPITAAWFNGTNGIPGHSSFVCGTATCNSSLSTLESHLIAFFGNALGCLDPAFVTAYPISEVVSDLHQFHGQFAVAVTKAAYEYFNQAVINQLQGLGVTGDDLFAVSKVLDGFRSTQTGAASTNVICQASDCLTPPFGVQVNDNFFSPGYLTLPSGGGKVLYTKKTLASDHPITDGTISTCTGASPVHVNVPFGTGQGASPVSVQFTHNYSIICNVHCGSTHMYSQVNVVGANSSARLVISLVGTVIITLAALLMI